MTDPIGSKVKNTDDFYDAGYDGVPLHIGGMQKVSPGSFTPAEKILEAKGTRPDLFVFEFVQDLAGTTGGDNASTFVDQGQSVTLTTIVHNGAGTLVYDWYKRSSGTDTKLVASGTKYNGLGTNSLTINGFGTGDVGDYFVKVTDANGTITSLSERLKMALFLSTDLSPTAAWTAAAAGTLRVRVVGGLLPYSYVWTKDGNVISGATTDTLTVATPSAADAGVYQCTVSDIRVPKDKVTSAKCTVTFS